MASVETTGPTVDDAIDAALDQLDLDDDQVDIEILSEGGDGPARVRVTPRPGALEGDDAEGDEDDEDFEDEDEDEEEEADDTGAEVGGGALAVSATADEPAEPIAWDETLATAGREILEDLLDYMGFPGEVDVLRAGKEAGTPTVAMAVVEGDGMGALIGRRGETLQALQFICQLLVNRRVGHWTRVLLDVEGYRSRRERFLKDTALRAAEKAMRYREPIELEPMVPSERRILHLALADHDYVTTHSEGEGDNRRVIVEPKPDYVRERGGPAPGGRPGRPRPFHDRGPDARGGGARGGGRGGRSGGGYGGGFGRR